MLGKDDRATLCQSTMTTTKTQLTDLPLLLLQIRLTAFWRLPGPSSRPKPITQSSKLDTIHGSGTQSYGQTGNEIHIHRYTDGQAHTHTHTHTLTHTHTQSGSARAQVIQSFCFCYFKRSSTRRLSNGVQASDLRRG